MSLDAGRLRVLVEVAHAGSIAAAAQRMSFTPSALSQQLAKLERELGCRLVDRGPGGTTLTKAGRVLVSHGEAVLGELRAAEEAVRAVLGAEPDRLAIGTFSTAGRILVPEALAAFRHDYPAARLSLLDLEPPKGYGLVTSRDLDLLITHRYVGVPLPGLAGLRRTRLLTDPLRLVLPADHPAADQARSGLADLADEEWISGGHGVPNRVCLGTLAKQAGVEPHVAYETQDYEVTLALIRAGLGISLVPESVLRRTDLTGLAVRELRGVRPSRQMYVVHRRRPAALVAAMVTLLLRSAETITTAV
ncbi:LysR family transcriptional regulator [Solihabitans fulvus]|uniref:LysR family transcriptional regulator n=1 Tax=Solihabitans fulvus TaxID=1892852 RepID=A0A5B2X811_9PSEU|nr:LysR substrate-binding domain-containing protein [Solihabitans fulvus]KAA2259547.1 LysR family transcriptional regulator [Solihabitans fulvus]